MPQSDLSDFAKRPATQIIGLGTCCATAYNISRFFNFKASFPFDWWITYDEGLINILRKPDVDFIYDKKELQLTPNAASVRHSTLGLLLHHEFPRDLSQLPHPVREDFRDYIDEPKQRTKYLLDKLFSLNRSDQRIVFVRRHSTPPALAQALSERFDCASWALASVKNFPNDPPFDWRGDPAIWDAELARFGISLDRTGHKPFTEIEPHFSS